MQLLDDEAEYATALVSTLDDASTFELAPVSLWVEDLSGVKALFERWAGEGVVAIGDHIRGDPDHLALCLQAIRIIKVNRKTLTLYEADDTAHLVSNLHRVITTDTVERIIDDWIQLWEGNREVSTTTFNYTLSGRRLDILLRANILPGHEATWARVLVAVEDVSDLYAMRRELVRKEAYARGLFKHSPVSLRVKDFSGVKRLFTQLRDLGVTDLPSHIAQNPDFLPRCMEAIQVVDINVQTLRLYGATRQPASDASSVDLRRLNLDTDLREQLIGLWTGDLFQERETVNRTMGGELIHVHLQLSVLPDHEDDWSLVQVARIDITARKAAEAHLEYLWTRDNLTQLRNRAFYNEELKRLDDAGVRPVTVIVADLNGLKATNDCLGHAEGDEMLRSAGTLLARLIPQPWVAARIGGDEFVILMPEAEESEGRALAAEIDMQVRLVNHSRKKSPLSLSLGIATSRPDESLEATVQRADQDMYAAKRQYYAGSGRERRNARSPTPPGDPGTGLSKPDRSPLDPAESSRT